MLNLKIGDCIIALNDLVTHGYYFYKGNKYQVYAYFKVWNGWGIDAEGIFSKCGMTEETLIKNFDYRIYQRKEKLKKINMLNE